MKFDNLEFEAYHDGKVKQNLQAQFKIEHARVEIGWDTNPDLAVCSLQPEAADDCQSSLALISPHSPYRSQAGP